MRRLVFLALGCLEVAIAAALAHFAYQLPARHEVEESVGRVQRVTERTSDQARLLRRQMNDMRRPELQELARQLQTQSRMVTATLKKQRLDVDQVQTISAALGDVARGLDGFAETLDADALGKLGQGLGSTATYLDEKVAPAAAKAAERFDGTTLLLREDAQRLAEFLKQAPPDLKAARDIHEGLSRFSEGLSRIQALLEGQRLGTMREGFKGLDTSLTTGAQQVERLSGYHYPIVTFRGVKPQIEDRKFWPQGGEIAEGMRKAAAGARAADEEMGALVADLPKLRASLEESRKVADRTRDALGLALKQQDKLEAVLKNVPEHTARLAEELPRLNSDLGRVLRDTERLTEVAAVLRQAQKGLDTAVARWPELRTALTRSATLLRTTRQQLDHALEHRDEYEAAMKQTVVLVESFAEVLPVFVEGLDRQLHEQEAGLDALGQSIDEVGNALPQYGEAASGLLGTARVLVGLMAVMALLHGGYLLATCRQTHRPGHVA